MRWIWGGEGVEVIWVVVVVDGMSLEKVIS